jgi:putative ABC transport system permease protein
VQSATAVLDTLSNTISIVQTFLGATAAIALLVAGIGIMNIMIVSLIERTREIGVLKALGTKSRTVLSIFLWEAVTIGLIGSVIGIASGWGIASLVSRVMLGTGRSATTGGILLSSITPVLTSTVVLGALAFGIGVSVLFALYPAWRASRIKPSEAMRYE